MRLKVATWNIHRCFGTDRRYWPERVAEGIRSLGADIVALQEVDSSLRVQGEVDQLSFLAQATGMTAVMGPTLKRDYGAYGNAILTKHPIESADELNLSYRKFEPRGALSANLLVSTSAGVKPIRIINVHLGLKYWERAFQIDQLLSKNLWPKSRSAPTILLGDFNEWFPLTVNQLRLKRTFDYSSPRASTFPAGWPRLALDRVFVDGEVVEFTSTVATDDLLRVASDHLPVLATVEFAPNMNRSSETATVICR